MESLKLIILCVVLTASMAQDAKVVNTTQGPVRGYREPNDAYYSFKSIPYASAPTGPNRFKAPLPPPVWLQPLEAVDNRIICPQSAFSAAVMPGEFIMHENCLILNVYAPDTADQNLPVVLFVHGGAFHIGYGDWNVPRHLIVDHNIIYITFNYRLGAHGFLSLGTEDIPGNAGMKDQLAALRWVKRNIANFGGNPNDITIHGSSAGSASVDLLMLSKSAEGLFSRVIAESAGSIAALTIQSDPLENAKSVARSFNFNDVDDLQALEEFYKNVPYETLMSYDFMSRKDSTFIFSPCVERTLGEDTFLDKSPVDIIKSGDYNKVPLLYGFTNMEGLLRINFFNVWSNDMNTKFSDFLPADLAFESEEDREKAADQIREFYFEDKPVNETTILSYVDYFTDVMFSYPMMRSVRLHKENGHDQIYLYEYSFVDDNTPYVPFTNVKGADHATQTLAVFGLMTAWPLNNTVEFETMSSTVRSIWSNFIKTSVPVSEGLSVPYWPAVGQGWSPHMAIGTVFSLEGPLLERRMSFWDDIYAQYYREPIAAQSSANQNLLNHFVISIFVLHLLKLTLWH